MTIPTFNNNTKIFENILNTEPTTHDGKHYSSSSSSLASEFGDATAAQAITKDATTPHTSSTNGTVDASAEGGVPATLHKKKKTAHN